MILYIRVIVLSCWPMRSPRVFIITSLCLRTNYENVATTVFTPLEYGCIGLSDEDPRQRYGDAHIEVYHANFTPLEWTVLHREENTCYTQLVCVKSQNVSSTLRHHRERLL